MQRKKCHWAVGNSYQSREAQILQCVQPSPMMVCFYINLSLAHATQRFSCSSFFQLVPAGKIGQRAINSTFVVVCDNVAFHHSAAVTAWFTAHPRISVLFLPPYSPFLNPIEEFFSAWRWKVYDHCPHNQLSLLDAMNVGCGNISPEACQVRKNTLKNVLPTVHRQRRHKM